MNYETFNNASLVLSLLEDMFVENEEDKNKLLRQLDFTEEEFNDIINEKIEPDKYQLESIFNYAYNHNLDINEIIWQYRLDEFRNDSVNVCSHGSRRNIVGDIRVDIESDSSDFGSGFYVGQDISQAGMWVAGEPDSSIYIFSFDESDLTKAQFNVGVDWMIAICYFRNMIPQYANHPKVQEILNRVNNCDYVLAPIADNKLYEVIESFVNEEITDLQCLYALSATHLGYQFVLKTEKAVQNLELLDHLYFCAVEKSMYNRESDVEENTSLHKAFMAKKRYKDTGKYISELLGDSYDS